MKKQLLIQVAVLSLVVFCVQKSYAQTSTTACYYYENTVSGTTEKCTITVTYDSVKVKASCKKEVTSGNTKKNNSSTKNGTVSGDTFSFQDATTLSPRMREMMTAKGLTPPSGDTEVWTLQDNKNKLVMDGKTYTKITCPAQ